MREILEIAAMFALGIASLAIFALFTVVPWALGLAYMMGWL